MFIISTKNYSLNILIPLKLFIYVTSCRIFYFHFLSKNFILKFVTPRYHCYEPRVSSGAAWCLATDWVVRVRLRVAEGVEFFSLLFIRSPIK